MTYKLLWERPSFGISPACQQKKPGAGGNMKRCRSDGFRQRNVTGGNISAAQAIWRGAILPSRYSFSLFSWRPFYRPIKRAASVSSQPIAVGERICPINAAFSAAPPRPRPTGTGYRVREQLQDHFQNEKYQNSHFEIRCLYQCCIDDPKR